MQHGGLLLYQVACRTGLFPHAVVHNNITDIHHIHPPWTRPSDSPRLHTALHVGTQPVGVIFH